MPKEHQTNPAGLHDRVFRCLYDYTDELLDLFKLLLSDEDYNCFDWTTLKMESNTFFDPELREKRADIVYSVQRQGLDAKFYVIFLLEHKSYQDSDVMQQMLEYQTRLYARHNYPVIPVLIYHGASRQWNRPLEFHRCLQWNPQQLPQVLHSNVLNFRCTLLNFNDERVQQKARGLDSRVVIYILSNIWNVTETVIETMFEYASEITNASKRKRYINQLALYIVMFNRRFTWDEIMRIEQRTTEEQEVLMAPFIQYVMNEKLEEGRDEERNKIALEMIQDGIHVKVICKYTNLTTEQIMKLQDEFR